MEKILARLEPLRNRRIIAMKSFLIIGVVVAATLLGGCSISKEYVAADQVTFDAVTPEYLEYVNADVKLDADAKVRRKRTVDSWKLRIDKAGK